jgi:hypothetical protein
MRPTRTLLLAVLLCAACGGQMGAGSSYPGDPLVWYSGQLTGTAPLPPFEVWFVWQGQLPPAMDAMTWFTSSSVQPTDDPARYEWSTSLYLPPFAGPFTQLQEGEVAFARGNVISVPQGWSSTRLDELRGSPVFGADLSHWVLYFIDDVQAGTLTEWWLGGARPTRDKYYLAAVTPAPCLDATALDQCVTDLRGRGVATDEAAQSFCLAPYRLTLVNWLDRGTIALGVSEFTTRACP